ncbi:unnamed protein product, partial [Choristocarpus tenellus]
DKWGRTPLHHACKARHMDVVRALLLQGVDPKTVDSDGHTPQDL